MADGRMETAERAGHGKPLVMIYTAESPLHELDPGSELTLQTKDSFCRQVEQELRLRLFQWRHIRCDMVMEGAYHVPYVWRDTGLGFTTQEDIRITDPDSPIMGHHYHVQIQDEKDIERIQPPIVLCDWELTERNCQAVRDLLEGVMPVRKRGIPAYNLYPADELCVWMGIEESMICLAERPELFHMGMKRVTELHLDRVRQLKELGLLTADFGNGLMTMFRRVGLYGRTSS